MPRRSDVNAPTGTWKTPKNAALFLRTQPRPSILARTLGGFPAITKRKHDPSDRSSPVVQDSGGSASLPMRATLKNRGPTPILRRGRGLGNGTAPRRCGNALRGLADPVVQRVVAS